MTQRSLKKLSNLLNIISITIKNKSEHECLNYIEVSLNNIQRKT